MYIIYYSIHACVREDELSKISNPTNLVGIVPEESNSPRKWKCGRKEGRKRKAVCKESIGNLNRHLLHRFSYYRSPIIALHKYVRRRRPRLVFKFTVKPPRRTSFTQFFISSESYSHGPACVMSHERRDWPKKKIHQFRIENLTDSCDHQLMYLWGGKWRQRQGPESLE